VEQTLLFNAKHTMCEMDLKKFWDILDSRKYGPDGTHQHALIHSTVGHITRPSRIRYLQIVMPTQIFQGSKIVQWLRWLQRLSRKAFRHIIVVHVCVHWCYRHIRVVCPNDLVLETFIPMPQGNIPSSVERAVLTFTPPLDPSLPLASSNCITSGQVHPTTELLTILSNI